MTPTRKPLLLALLISFLAAQTLVPLQAFASEGGEKKAAEGEHKGGEKKDKKEEDGDVTGGRFDGDPIYVHLAPIILPVITDEGVEQLVTVIFDVQVSDRDAVDLIHRNMPRVMDSLMRHLYGGLGQGSLRNGKVVNVTRLKNKAAAAVKEIVGDKMVTDVLVQNIAQRML